MNALAFGLYILFMCSWFLHLPERITVLGMLRADVMLVGLITALILISSNDQPEEVTADRRTRKLLLTLFLYSVATVPFVEWPGSVLWTGLPNFLKAVVFFYFTLKLVTTPKRLGWLLAVFVLCQTFRVMEPLYLHVTDGYWGSTAHMSDDEDMERLAGAPNDVINPNGLAFVVLTAMPFLHYLSAGSKARRIGYAAVAPLLLWALVLTASRSGMVGLAAILGLIWIKSRHKIFLASVVALTIVISAPLLSANLSDRYLSIVSSNTKNSVTARGRVEGLRANLQVTMRRPLFGHGLGTSREANFHFGPTDQPAHNLYVEAAEEIGLCGLLLFVMYMSSVLRDLGRCARTLRGAIEAPSAVRAVVPALQVWIGMNLLFSFASYGLSSYEWYLAGALTEVVRRLIENVPAPAAVETAPATAPPIRAFAVGT